MVKGAKEKDTGLEKCDLYVKMTMNISGLEDRIQALLFKETSKDEIDEVANDIRIINEVFDDLLKDKKIQKVM